MLRKPLYLQGFACDHRTAAPVSFDARSMPDLKLTARNGEPRRLSVPNRHEPSDAGRRRLGTPCLRRASWSSRCSRLGVANIVDACAVARGRGRRVLGRPRRRRHGRGRRARFRGRRGRRRTRRHSARRQRRSRPDAGRRRRVPAPRTRRHASSPTRSFVSALNRRSRFRLRPPAARRRCTSCWPRSVCSRLLVGASVRLRRPRDQATLHFFWLCVAFFGAFTFSFNGPFDRLDWTFYWGDAVAMALLAAAAAALHAGLPRTSAVAGVAAAVAAAAGHVSARRSFSARPASSRSRGAPADGAFLSQALDLLDRAEPAYLFLCAVGGGRSS